MCMGVYVCISVCVRVHVHRNTPGKAAGGQADSLQQKRPVRTLPLPALGALLWKIPSSEDTGR